MIITHGKYDDLKRDEADKREKKRKEAIKEAEKKRRQLEYTLANKREYYDHAGKNYFIDYIDVLEDRIVDI